MDNLTKHERAFLKRRFCGWCEAPIASNSCYAMYGKPCTIKEMQIRRINALSTYKPRRKSADA